MRVKIFVRSAGYTSELSDVSSLLEEDFIAWLETHPTVRVTETRRTSYRARAEPSKHLMAVWYKLNSGIPPLH